MEIEQSNWSELCPEILLEIADRLGTRPNVYNFRQVCKKWRFSLSYIPRTLPQIFPLFPRRIVARDTDFFSTLSRGTLHHLIADAVYLLRPRKIPESSKPWLVTVEELYRGKLTVRLPLTKVRAGNYLSATERFSKTLNLLDFDVNLIARGYILRAPLTDRSLEPNGGLSCKNKVVLFANTAGFEPLSIGDYTALVWFDHGRVAWVRLSRPSDWGYLSYKDMSKFDDIVCFNERVYAVDRTGKIYAVNYDLELAEEGQTLRVECIVSDSVSSGYDSVRRKRLVVDSSGVLFVVEMVAYHRGKVHFKVYKLNEECFKLDEVAGLGGDRILFVSVDWCFFASAADFPGCKGNCIIFSISSFPRYHESISFDDFSARGGRKSSEVSVFWCEDGNSGPITAFPMYSDLFWPPPAWFCPNVVKPSPLRFRSE